MLELLHRTGFPIYLFVGIALGGFYYWNNLATYEAQDAQIAAKNQELAVLDEAIKSAKRIASDREKFEQENQKVSDQLKAAIEFLPNKLNEQEVLVKITNEAHTAGVNPTSIQPKKAQKKTFYEELQMDVELEGSYAQLVLFLANTSKIHRIVNIIGVDLKVLNFVDDIPILKMKGTLVAYRYIENSQESAAAAKPGAPATAKPPGVK